MRDTMVDTGLHFEELHELRVVYLGCLSAVQRLQRRGLLPRQEHLCLVAARSGNLEKLKALRENYWPWDEGTCAAAAQGGHLEVLQWTRANGCPWDEMTCNYARNGENPDSGCARTIAQGGNTISRTPSITNTALSANKNTTNQ